MKTSFFISLTVCASLLMSACNNHEEELAKSKHEKDSLMSVLGERDSSINGFLGAFNDIERNLDSVAAKQKVIYLNTTNGNGELKQGQQERINAEIEAINNMMEENSKTIAELENKLKKSSRKNAQLEKTIVTLNNQLAQRYLELTALNEQLSKLNLQVAQLQTSLDTLNMQNLAQSQTIAERTTALHTAYYIVGKSKELQDAKLIDKKGGLLGIGRTAKLNANMDNSKFTRIDYMQTNTVQINSKNPKIITTHPSDSYVLNKDAANKNTVIDMTITNPEKFWSMSKYLVVLNN